MPITDPEKIDFLLKKVGYEVAKTDKAALKGPSNESISSPILINSSNLWLDSIPSNPTSPEANSVVEKTFVRLDPIITSSKVSGQFISWKAPFEQWIPSSYGSAYAPNVYVANSGNGLTSLPAASAIFPDGTNANNNGYILDYSAGVIHFADATIPVALTGVNRSVYLEAYRYIGAKGSDNANGIPRKSSDLTQFSSTSASGLRSKINEVTGSGALVFQSGAYLSSPIVTGNAVFYNDVSISGNLNLKGSQITFDQSTINSLFITANSGNFQTLTVDNVPVSVQGHVHTTGEIVNFIESVQDVIGSGNGATGFLRNGSGLAWTYDDNNHTLSARVTGIDTSLINNFASTVSGLFNDQFNNDLNAALIQGTGIGLSYDSDTEELTISVTGIPKSLAGLSNVTNDAQVKKISSSTNGNIPVWDGITGDLLGNGYSVETTLTGGATAIPRADAVKSYVDASFNANDAMQFKGIVNQTNGLPAGTVSAGWTYRVAQNGTYAGVVCEVGDLIIATGDAAGSIDNTWTVVQTNIDGAVVGPVSSTTDNFALFNGTGGKVIQDAGFGSGVFARSNLSIQISGTTNQINIDGGASASKDLSSNRTWTLSLPQNIHTGASPTFAGLTINGSVSANGFSGSGNLLTNINANNITGVLDSGRLPVVHASTLTPTTTGPSGTFVSSINIDSYGRVTGLNRTTHTLATTGTAGIASFNSGDFDVSAGAVSIKTSGIGNAQLEYNSITLGSTTISLGATTGILAGLSSISGTSVSSPTTLTFCVIDGGTP